MVLALLVRGPYPTLRGHTGIYFPSTFNSHPISGTRCLEEEGTHIQRVEAFRQAGSSKPRPALSSRHRRDRWWWSMEPLSPHSTSGLDRMRGGEVFVGISRHDGGSRITLRFILISQTQHPSKTRAIRRLPIFGVEVTGRYLLV